jgi:hypothetical protein
MSVVDEKLVKAIKYAYDVSKWMRDSFDMSNPLVIVYPDYHVGAVDLMDHATWKVHPDRKGDNWMDIMSDNLDNDEYKMKKRA